MTSSNHSLDDYKGTWYQRQLGRVAATSANTSQAHQDFLAHRHAALHQLALLTRSELAALGAKPLISQPRAVSKPALFDQSLLDEFGRGSIVRCLGPAFSLYAGRRSPRIPNGDLLMMSRILSIDGQKRSFDRPSQIVTEFDVPAQAWFIQPEAFASLPKVVLMEMALQSCGFLSAYLETSLTHPEQDYYFRNLDGQATLLASPDLRGQTVTNHARLLRTTISSDIIIQHFEFQLSVDGNVFYQGSSSFGYFPYAAMANQAGLDGGKQMPLWLNSPAQAGITAAPLQLLGLQNISQPQTANRLAGLDQIAYLPHAGRYQQGYLSASRVIHPEDWYFQYHFYEDAVMPGSLGIEAVLYALRVYALQTVAAGFHAPKITFLENENFTWKYRGQILPQNRRMDLEVHIQKVDLRPGRVDITADASLWSDQVRIYAMNQIGITILEG